MDTVFPFLELFTLTKNTMDTAFLVFTLNYFYLLCNFFQSLFTPHVFWFSPWGANVLVKVLFDSKCLLASGAAEWFILLYLHFFTEVHWTAFSWQGG